MLDTETLKLKMLIETKKIRNPSLQLYVHTIIQKLPEKAWLRESSLKFHPEDERQPGGNIIHEARVSRLAGYIAEVSNCRPIDKDLVRAAGLLHDAARHDLDATAKYTVKNHAELVRDLLKQLDMYDNNPWALPLCDIIDSHMSRWGVTPYTPNISLKDALVLADYIASQVDVEVKI